MNEHSNSAAVPILRFRLLHIETSTSNPGDVTEIGRSEMEIQGAETRIDTPQRHLFRPPHETCTQQDLVDAANAPEMAHVLVTHDLAPVAELIPSGLTAPVRWVGVGRLLTQVAPECPAGDPDAAAAYYGLTPVLDAMPDTMGTTARHLGALALLTTHLHTRLGLERMVRFSTYMTRPIGPIPALDEDLAWTHMPLSALRWLAEFRIGAALAGLKPDELLDPDVGARALREFNRRKI